MPNTVDRRHRERLRQAIEAEGLEIGPQLIGALEGLAIEIREQRSLTERMIDALGTTTGAIKELTKELSEQRRKLTGDP